MARATSREPLAIAATILLGIAFVSVLSQFDGLEADSGTAAAALGAVVCLTVILAGPIPCLAAIAGLTTAGLVPDIARVGTVDFTLADVFFLGLLGWWLRATIGRAQRVLPPRRWAPFGQLAAIVFLAYSGLTLWSVAIGDPPAFENSFVSWLRLVQTVAIAWLAASVIESPRDVRLLVASIALGGVVAVMLTVADGGSLLEGRSGATVGPNALGLIAGLLLLIGAFATPKRQIAYRCLLLVAGAIGLLVAKSVASFVAAGLALAVGAALVSGTGSSQRVTRGVVALAVAIVLVFGLVQVVRPEAIPGSEAFRSGSAAHRLVVGAAGLEVFERNPLIGVGWRGSDSPRVIGDRDVVADVRQRFPDVRPIFYPDVNPTSVHNTYIQILADLGLVGFVLFVVLVTAIGLRARSLLRRLGRAHELWSHAFAISLGLLLVLIWHNDNPLYGGQLDTVLPALLVGGLAAISRLTLPVAQTAETLRHPPAGTAIASVTRAGRPPTGASHSSSRAATRDTR